MVEDIKKFMQENGLTQAQIARSLGKSAGQISQYFGGYYKGDVENLEKDLKNFMNSYKNRDKGKDSERIVSLRNMKGVNFLIDEVIISKTMGVILGDAGVGKTVAIKSYMTKNPAHIFVEAVPGMQFKSVLEKIAQKAKVNTSGKRPEELIYSIASAFKNTELVLIIDEAENLTTKTLEGIRRIWDFSRVPIVLVGTYSLSANLNGRNGELRQLSSRISKKFEFEPLSEDDWRALFGEWADEIKNIDKDKMFLRKAVSIYNSALRFASINGDKLNTFYINEAKKMVFLD